MGDIVALAVELDPEQCQPLAGSIVIQTPGGNILLIIRVQILVETAKRMPHPTVIQFDAQVDKPGQLQRLGETARRVLRQPFTARRNLVQFRLPRGPLFRLREPAGQAGVAADISPTAPGAT